MKINRPCRRLIAFVVSLCPLLAYAQHAYTLDECLELALKNNVRIRNADNDLNAAKLQKKAAFTNYFPTVSASGGGFLADKGLLEMDTESGRLSLVDDGIVGGVTATLPLFAGGQIVNANRLADVNVEVSRLLRRQSENEVRLTVEQYFWQVVTLKEKLRTISMLQSQLEQIRRDVEAAVTAGVTDRNDRLQVELRNNEMRSRHISVSNTLDVSLHLLAQYMVVRRTVPDISMWIGKWTARFPRVPMSFTARLNHRFRSPWNTVCWTNRWMPAGYSIR